MWGRNSSGECSVDPAVANIVSPPVMVTFKPILPPAGQEKSLPPTKHYQAPPFKVLLCACGGAHTMVVNQDNDVFAFGQNDQG